MDFICLPEGLAKTRELLFAEGHLNENFIILENFEMKYKKKFFVEEAVNYYCEKSRIIIENLEEQLQKTPPDFVMLERLLNQMRKHTVSIGAEQVLNKVNQLRNCVKRRSIIESVYALREVKLEAERFESKILEFTAMFRHPPPSELNADHPCEQADPDEGQSSVDGK